MKARALALSALSLTISIPLATAYSGEMTHYTPAYTPTGSSCNMAAQPGEPVVAISKTQMNNPPNPNNNPLCGTYISIYNPYNQHTVQNVKIVDTCVGCSEGDIDVNVELFEALGFDAGAGRVKGMDWGGHAIGGKRSAGLAPLTVPRGEKRQPRHPHGKVEKA